MLVEEPDGSYLGVISSVQELDNLMARLNKRGLRCVLRGEGRGGGQRMGILSQRKEASGACWVRGGGGAALRGQWRVLGAGGGGSTLRGQWCLLGAGGGGSALRDCGGSQVHICTHIHPVGLGLGVAAPCPWHSLPR